MGAFAEYLASQQAPAEAPVAPVDDTPGQFGTGLRSGLQGAYSQLQALGGNVAEAVGADDLARTAYQGMRESKAAADAAAPRVGSYKDVHDLRSGYDYVTGLLGASVPESALAVGGAMLGSTPVGRAVGATVAMTPLEAGDVVQRQQEDPTAAQAPAGERLVHALGGGATSAAAQAVLPAIVGGKLAGPAAGVAERMGARQVIANGLREAPLSMGIEAAGNVAGEAAKQGAVMADSPDRTFDTEALKEAGVGGLAAGAAMHGVGVAGEAAHAAAGAPGNVLSGVAGKARDAVAAAQDKLAGSRDAAPDTAPKVDMPDPVEAVRGIYDKGVHEARAFWDTVAKGEDTATLLAKAGQTAEQIKQALPTIDADRVQKVADAARELWDNKGLTEDQRAQLQTAMADLADRGNQAVVAGFKRGQEAGQDFAAKAKDLYTAFSSKFEGKPAEDSSGAKRSEDFSGADGAVAEAIVPLMQKANPDIFTNPEALRQAGAALRMALTQMRDGNDLGSTYVARLIDTFGDQTANILEAAHRALHSDAVGAQREDFYRGLKAVNDYAGKGDRVQDFMMRSMKPELQDTVRASDVKRELDVLRHVTERAKAGSAEAAFKLDQLRTEMQGRYGDNTEKILAQIEKEFKPQANVLDAERVKTDPDTGERAMKDSHGLSIAEGVGKDGTVYYGPEKGGLSTKDSPQAVTAMERARKQHPGYEPAFLSAEQLGADHPRVQQQLKDLQQQFMAAGKTPEEAAHLAKEAVRHYGAVAVVKTETPGHITKDNIGQVQVKNVETVGRSKYNQPSVFKAGGTAYDAIALTKMMDKQFKGERATADDKGAIHRNARMFMEGVGALQDHLGKAFDIPDSLVIDHQGTTVADAKKLGFAPPNRGAEILEGKLKALRERFANAQTDAERAKIRAEAQDAVDKAKAFDPRMDIPDVKQEGQPDVDPFGNVHAALKGGDNPDAVIRTNLTGNSRERDQGLGGKLPTDAETAAKSGPVKGTSDVLREKLQGWVDKPPSAAAKAVAEKGLALLDNKAVLSAKDKKGLAALLSEGTKASQVAGTVNALYEKYRGKFEGKDASASAPAKAETKAEAPKPEKAAALADHPIDQDFAKEKYPEFKSAKEVDDYLLQAYKRWGELAQEDRRVMNDEGHPTNELPESQRAAYFRMAEMFGRDSHMDLGSFDPGELDLGGARDTQIRAMLRKAAPEVAGQVPKYFRPVGDVKYSKVSADATAKDLKARAEEVQAHAESIEDEAGEIAGRAAKLQEAGDVAGASELMKQFKPLQDAANAMYSAARGLRSEAETRTDYERGMERTNLTEQKKQFLGVVRSQIDEMVAEHEAKVQKALDSIGRQSMQGVGTQRVDAQALKDVRAYVDRVLGPSVKTALAKIPHAGEYVNDTIRLSIHALNPMSVAYHESLHAFFDKLSKQGNGDVQRVLERAALSAPIQNQLRKMLAGEHAALAQLRNPEEAAAYMYQFWAAGKLKVGTGVGSLFERVKQAIGRVLGILTNDQRAAMVMDYFHSGEFKTQGMGQPNAVARALIASGRNQVIERARALGKPLTDVADALTVAGAQRLRDTGVPALRELADLMKVTGREASDDHGFVPTVRVERTRVMNEFGQKLKGYTEAHFDEALQAMQSGKTAASAQARAIQDLVQGQHGLLPTMLKYMKDAGVDVDKIQPRPDYFPRLYDAHYISRHQAEFQTVLEANGLSAKEARAITLNLMATNGAEFTVETDRPGNQFLKPRQLAMIPDAQLAPYMRKNMFEILGSYVTQATRRAEWARRFGDDGQGITRMLERAKAQGADDKQLETARKFVRAVDGTLGDTLSPTARRVMGNMIVYQNWRLLPLAIFSSVVDPLGIMVRGGTVRDAWGTFKRGVKEIPASFRNDFKADADTELAATLGVIDHAMLADATGQSYMQGLVGDGAKKINDALFRFNLMEGFNRSMRVGATQAAIRFLDRHRDGTASAHSVRWLNELGLEPGFKMDLADPKVRAAVNMWVDGAVLRPDAVDKPIWMNDPHYMLVAHLKQFVYAFQETILKRVAHEFQQGNYAPAMALASYVPVMIASDLVKGMIQGGGQLPEWKQDWGPADYLGSGIERAGLLGKRQFAVDGPGMMMGPTLQQAFGVAQALDGKGHVGVGAQVLKAMPGETLYSGWLGGGGTRVENSMAVD